jgi:hypothetical protein
VPENNWRIGRAYELRTDIREAFGAIYSRYPAYYVTREKVLISSQLYACYATPVYAIHTYTYMFRYCTSIHGHHSTLSSHPPASSLSPARSRLVSAASSGLGK